MEFCGQHWRDVENLAAILKNGVKMDIHYNLSHEKMVDIVGSICMCLSELKKGASDVKKEEN